MDRSHPYQGQTSRKGKDNPCIFIFKIERSWRWREQLFQASLSLVYNKKTYIQLFYW